MSILRWAVGGWMPKQRFSPRNVQGVSVRLTPEKIVVLLTSAGREGHERRSLGLAFANGDESIIVEAEIPDMNELIHDLQEGCAWVGEE